MSKQLWVIVIALLYTSLFSVVLHVPSEYPNIQSAVSSSLDGDTIMLSDGVYTGSMNRGILIENKNIVIRSQSNEPTNCIIDCEYLDRAFTFGQGVQGASVLGITIRNGRSLYAPIGFGGAIFVYNDSSIIVEKCIISNAVQAISLGDHETFNTNNPLTTITNTIFRNNYRCILQMQSSAYISGCLFEDNTSLVWHNGHRSDPESTMENCIIRNNDDDPAESTALILLSHSTKLINCLIYNNYGYHSIIFMGTIWSGQNLVDHCTIADNTSYANDSNWYDHLGTIKNSIIWGPGSANDYIGGKFSSIEAFNSCLVGTWVGPGANNIFIDPQFVDPNNQNYSLQPTSPCVGTGEGGSNRGCNPDLLPIFADVFDIIATPTNGQVPLPVAFTISPSPAIDSSIQWDFENDGITDSNEPSPTQTYTAPGTYSVKLIIHNGTEIDTTLVEDMITVTMPSTPRIVATPDTLRYGNVATNSTVSKPMNIYNWGGEDLEIYSISAANARYSITLPAGLSYPIVVPSLSSVEINVNFTPLTVQAYNTNLVIVSNDPDNGVLTKRLEGSGYVLSANFSATPLSGDIPLLMQFNDMSQGDIVSRLWDFGDGNTSAELNPTHTYVQKGLYDVTLTIHDQYISRSITRPDYISAIAHPVIATPDSSGIDFGIVYLGDTGTSQLILQSAGTDTVFVTSVGFYQPGSAYSVAPESIPNYILPGTQAVLDINFHPYQASAYNDTLYVYNSSENKPILKIKLRGIGEYVPPQTPQGVTIVIDGYDAVISWEAVTQNIYNTPITVPYYFIYGSLIPNPGPTEQIFIGYSTGTTFHHAGVNLPGSNVQPPLQYFYTVTAVVWYPPRNNNIVLDGLIGSNREEVERQLRQ